MPRRSVSVCSGDRSLSPPRESARQRSKKSPINADKKLKRYAKDEIAVTSTSDKDRRKDWKRENKPTCLSVVSPKNMKNDGVNYTDQSIKMESSVQVVDKDLVNKKRKYSKTLRDYENVQCSSVEDISDTTVGKRRKKHVEESYEIHKSLKKPSENSKFYQSGIKTSNDLHSRCSSGTRNAKDGTNISTSRKSHNQTHHSPQNLVSISYSSPPLQLSSREHSPIHYIDNKRSHDSNRDRVDGRQRSPKYYKSSVHNHENSYKSRKRDSSSQDRYSHSRSDYLKTKDVVVNREYDRNRHQDSRSYDRGQPQHGSPRHKSNAKTSHNYHEPARSNSRSRRSSSPRHYVKDYDQPKVYKLSKAQTSKDRVDREGRHSKNYKDGKSRDYNDRSLSNNREMCDDDYLRNSDSVSRVGQISNDRMTQKHRSRSGSATKHHRHHSSANKYVLPDHKYSKSDLKVNNKKHSSETKPSTSTTAHDSRKMSRSMSSGSDDRKRHRSHSSSPPRLTQLLFDFMTDLTCDDVSDSELQSSIPLSMFNYVADGDVHDLDNQFEANLDNKNKTDPSSTNLGNLLDCDQQQQSGDAVDEDKDNDQLVLSNSNFAMESLEKLSNQMRQHMAGPETWDTIDTGSPLDIEYGEDQLNPSVASLAIIKPSMSTDNYCIPWQELIESAVKDLSTIRDTDLHDSIVCVGSSIGSSDRLQAIIPLHKRTTGLQILRTTGISRRFAGDFATDFDNVDEKSVGLNTSQLAWSSRIAAHLNRTLFNNCDSKSSFIVPLNEQTDSQMRQQMLLHSI